MFGFLLLEVWNRLSLIRVVMKFNPIHLRHGLSSKSSSDWPLDPPHTHTHKHCSTFMQEIEISQADTQAWTKCQPQATGTEKEPMLIITEEKSHHFTCKTCHPGYLWIMKSFSLFPCGHAKGDTKSRSIKAVISFVPDVFSLSQSFSFITLSNCAVRVLK